jgi:hypothetical protein
MKNFEVSVGNYFRFDRKDYDLEIFGIPHIFLKRGKIINFEKISFGVL